LKIKNQTFSELIHQINPSKVIGFSTKGKMSSYEKLQQTFQMIPVLYLEDSKGHFSDLVENTINDLYSVGDESFEGHVVVARMLYEYEKTIFM
jgi:hypothetical protein